MGELSCPYCKGTGILTDEVAHAGQRIFAFRMAQNMTQDELAGKVGRTRAQIANIEAGRTDMPVRQLVKFAEALGVRPSELLP